MTEEHDEAAVGDASTEQDLQLQDGDILRFPLIEVGGKESPLSMRREIEIAAGPHGERLGLQQAKVFQEIQTYLASKHARPKQELKNTSSPE